MAQQLNLNVTQRFTWVGILTVVTVASTWATACSTPFVALATLGAMHLPRRDALRLIGFNWVVNQAIGFIWLKYPLTWDCYVGGASIGIAAALGTQLAILVSSRLRHRGPMATSLGSFAVAFLTYESVLAVLSPSSSLKYLSVPIVSYILLVNAVSFVGLLFIRAAALSMGFAIHKENGMSRPTFSDDGRSPAPPRAASDAPDQRRSVDATSATR
jgi:hypothetical protein